MPHPTRTFVLALGLTVPGVAQSYTIQDLGILPNSTAAYARAINESGEVCGFCRDPQFQTHAFVWSDGVMTELTEQGWSNVIAQDLDNLGRAVGNAITTTGFHAFLFSPGIGLQDLGTVNGGPLDLSGALAINGRGEIVGSDQPGAGPARAFRWFNGQWTVLPNLTGGTYSVGQTINEGGVVAGIADKPPSGLAQAVQWDAAGKIKDLSGSNGVTGGVRGSNDGGVVGQGSTKTQTTREAQLWRFNGSVQALGVLAPGFPSDAYAINHRDFVVGSALDAGAKSRAFLWTPATGIQDLNGLIPPGTGWVLEFATGINDAGEIVGNGKLNGLARAFLLRPPGCLTQVRPLGARFGQTLAFRHSSPCHAGLLAVTLFSASGKGSTLTLPGGVPVQLTPDALTFTLLTFPAVSVKTLDSQGLATTAGFKVIRDPWLIGQPLWVASAVLDLNAGAFVAASPTSTFTVVP